MNRFVSQGEMRVPDDDEDDYGMESPSKTIDADLLKKNFNAPFGVGGNEAALPSVFKPKLDPKMLVTPTAAQKFPKPEAVTRFEEAGPDLMDIEELASPNAADVTRNALLLPEADIVSQGQSLGSKKTKKVKKKKKRPTGWQN